MDLSSAQHHHQEMTSQELESMLVCSTKPQQEKKPRPPSEQALNCPRCDSINTKFCYYNNYSLSQPRYFCKSCRRYWTKGGTLRNVPVGGGCRRNKRSPSSLKRSQDQPLITNPSISTVSPLSYDCNDLNFAFSRLQKQTTGQLGFDDHQLPILGNPKNTHFEFLGNNGVNTCAPNSGFLETANAFRDLYYGFGNGNIGRIENGDLGLNMYKEMTMPCEDMSGATTVKQEFFNGREGENRVPLWGYPWQLGGDGNLGDHNSGLQSWSGLVNSPLM